MRNFTPTTSSEMNYSATSETVNSTSGSVLVSTTTKITPFELYSSTGTIVAYSLVYGCISVVGLTGNLMVFIVMFMNRSMHSPTNVLLLNLSLSDIVFVAFTVPGLLTMEICNYRWPYSEALGKINQLTTILCFASSIFTMMAIAFERYLAVVYPLRQLARKKKTTIVIAMVIIWLCAIALSIPMGIYTIVVSRHRHIKRDGKIVYEEIFILTDKMTKGQRKIYYMVILMSISVVPLLFLSFFYSRIVWKLWNPDRQLAEETGSSSNHQKSKRFVEKTRRKTTTMLLAIVLVFFLCIFPYNLFAVLIEYRDRSEFNYDVLLQANSVLRVLLVVNTASNPLIYNFLSEKFRTGFKSIFACRWRALRRVSATTDVETVLS